MRIVIGLPNNITPQRLATGKATIKMATTTQEPVGITTKKRQKTATRVEAGMIGAGLLPKTKTVGGKVPDDKVGPGEEVNENEEMVKKDSSTSFTIVEKRIMK